MPAEHMLQFAVVCLTIGVLLGFGLSMCCFLLAERAVRREMLTFIKSED